MFRKQVGIGTRVTYQDRNGTVTSVANLDIGCVSIKWDEPIGNSIYASVEAVHYLILLEPIDPKTRKRTHRE